MPFSPQSIEIRLNQLEGQTAMTLEQLYRQEERIGDKLSRMEMQNEQGKEWREKYAALEAQFSENQRAIARAEKGE